MKLLEEDGIIFILDGDQLAYIIDTKEKACWSKEFNQWVSLEGLLWEEFDG